MNLFSLSALLCLLLLMAGNVLALDEIDGLEDELLEPDKAFAIDISSVDDSTLQVTWDIADGYYMYRDRIRFSTDTPGMQLGEPSLPAGKIKDDEFFGKIAVFRNQVTATIPVTRSGEGSNTLRLKAVSQLDILIEIRHGKYDCTMQITEF